MKSKKWLILVISLAVVLLSSSVGVTRASLVDQETSAGNRFQAWASTVWRQTSQAEFELGVLSNVDTSSSPDDVKLAVKSGWYNASWAYRKQITIDHTKVSANLTDFPILVNLSSDSDLASHAQGDGDDILFTDSNGAKLDHEVESFEGASGKLIAWVRVLSLSSTADTVLYMYYGNAGCSSQQNATGTWDGNFKAVWHSNETSGSIINDSTANNNDGTPQNGVTLDATGKIDGADTFDGTDDWTNLGTSSSLNFGASAPFTIEGWYKATESYGTIFSFRHNTNDGADIDICVGYDGAVDSAGKLMGLARQDSGSGSYARVTGPTVNNGNWHYFVLTRNAGNTIQLFSDGVSQGTSSGSESGGAITTNIRALGSERRWVQVGYGNADQRYLIGTIDEVRVSNVQRSSSWISACFNNQNSPSTFYSLGGEVGRYVSSGSIASQVLDTTVSGARWDALFWDKTLPSGTNITFQVRAANTLVGGFPDASWIPVGGTSPVTSGLPSGQYMQWQATLTTSDTSQTPILHEVRVYYY
jgi:hypothetical protein